MNTPKEGLPVNLWQSFVNGNDAAYEQIYKDNVSALFDYGMKLVGEKTIVEDCIHELFVELWQKRNRLKIKSSILHYLLISTRRKIFRYIKKSGRHNELNWKVLNNNAQFIDIDAEQTFINTESAIGLNNKLIKEVGALSRRQHEVVSLRFFHDMSYEEISTIMGISPNATYNLMSKAIATLKKMMISIVLTSLCAFLLEAI